MISTRLSLIVMLLAFVNGDRNEDAAQPCAQVQTSSPVVALGSPVSATCAIREDCPVTIGPTVRIEWQLDSGALPNDSVVNQSGRISQVVIPSFNSTMAFLTCCVQTSPPQIVGGVQIKAGYLPSVPQNLHCQTNLTNPNTMLCSWEPGRDSRLPTKYSLHTDVRNLKKIYELPAGVHHYILPRSDFTLFSEMEIYVKAVNELGETKTVPVILEPVSVAKFDPPEILNIYAVPKKYGCLKICWEFSPHLSWMKCIMNVEVRLMAAHSKQWTDQHTFERRSKTIDYCRLQNGTRYVTQMRVRYKQSPWSEWSHSRSGVTLESAPAGRLDSWMKVSRDHTHKQVNVHLFWKPSKQFRANGQNVSYVVSLLKQPGERGQLCATPRRYCIFQAPEKARKLYLSAVNAAGRSQPTDIRIYHTKANTAIPDLTVTSYNNTSLMVQWASQDTPSLLGHMVEWRPLLETDPAYIQFQSTSKNQSSLIIAGSIEPYKPYGISVYPRFKDGIGLPRTANAFSRQKAPSKVPQLRIEKTWQFGIELTWDEIPLDERNGKIQSYQVFYRAENGTYDVVVANALERRVLLKDLNPMSVYEAFLMASTFGGSQNGTKIHFKTESFDMVTVVITVTGCLTVLVLTCFIIAAVCSAKHKRFKSHFCPMIPDPANSSINDWTTESLENILPAFNSVEPSLVYLSHLSFLDLPTKIQKEEDDSWLNNPEDTSDLGESICGSPCSPGYCGTNSDSVPYATVIFSSPCTSPASIDNHIYLRSESTQPLLEAEEAFTPKCYHNIAADKTNTEQRFFGPSDNDEIEEVPEPDIVWDEFPFLRALAMNDKEHD